ncbi:MAG: hypothetical protein LC754_02580 [Acidobacteria bacterium]|nr:hypothetical protein [Acidobacteriota bacterium]
MTFIARLVLCSFLLFASASYGFSQKRFCPKPPPSPFKHSGQIVTSYDPSVDKMRTTLEHPRVLGKGTDAVYLSATFVHQDPRRPAAPTMDLIFISTSAAPKYHETHSLVFFCDGKQCPLHSAARYQSQPDGHGTIYEATRLTLSYEDLLAITSARKVAARLGQTEFELTSNHLEALREIFSLLAPSPGRWRAEE